MKKILIYLSISDLKPLGGPRGYLYNLNNGFSKINDKSINICYLPPKQGKSTIDTILGIFEKFKFGKLIKHYLYIVHLLLNKGKSSNIDFYKYDIVHFHTTTDFYVNRNNLKNYKGKIILTSHSPMPNHQEIIDFLRIKNLKIKTYILKRLEKIDIYAFNNANYIVFPCSEAEECYYNTRDKYKQIHENNKDKYIYIPTGLIPIEIKESKEELRKKYGISNNNLVLCYVGRHNEVKGYNNLKKLGENYLNKNENSFFLIAGTEEPIKGLKNKRWKEIGWTNKPHEIIKSSDIFILPNKETYFDLILLEVLSLGKPILLTRTGGNKYFEKFNDTGLYFYDYDNQAEFNNILDKLSRENLDQNGAKNKELFDTHFKSEVFARNYIDMYKNLS